MIYEEPVYRYKSQKYLPQTYPEAFFLVQLAQKTAQITMQRKLVEKMAQKLYHIHKGFYPSMILISQLQRIRVNAECLWNACLWMYWIVSTPWSYYDKKLMVEALHMSTCYNRIWVHTHTYRKYTQTQTLSHTHISKHTRIHTILCT